MRATTGTDAALMLVDCRPMNVAGCTVLGCRGTGALMTNCPIRTDPRDAGPWAPVGTVGQNDVTAADNAICDNPLGRPARAVPKATQETSP